MVLSRVLGMTLVGILTRRPELPKMNFLRQGLENTARGQFKIIKKMLLLCDTFNNLALKIKH